MYPSFIASSISMIFAIVAFYCFISNYSRFTHPEIKVGILILFSIAVGIHGLSHNISEIYYDFNPFKNKWIPKEPSINKGLVRDVKAVRDVALL